MSPTSPLPLRRATALVAVAWALSAILPSLSALRAPPDALSHPFLDSRLGRVAVVHTVHPSAAARGLEVGDRIVAFDGEPFFPIAIQSRERLRAGVANRYEV